MSIPIELTAMLAGGVSGFVMNFMAAQAERQAKSVEQLIQLQGVADDSHEKAAARCGTFGRRTLLFAILWLVAFAPLLGAMVDIPTFVEADRADWDIFGLFTGGWTELRGIVLLDEVRAGFTAAVGFWLGGAAVGRKR